MSRKIAFIANQNFFHQQKTLRTSLKAAFLRIKTSLAHAFLRCPQKIPIFTNQKFFFCRKLYELSSKTAFFTYKKPFIRTNLSLLLSKASLFHPPSPIRITLNLLSTKNTAVLLQSALILCCKAGTSHRFKSLPAIPGKLQFSA